MRAYHRHEKWEQPRLTCPCLTLDALLRGSDLVGEIGGEGRRMVERDMVEEYVVGERYNGKKERGWDKLVVCRHSTQRLSTYSVFT